MSSPTTSPEQDRWLDAAELRRLAEPDRAAAPMAPRGPDDTGSAPDAHATRGPGIVAVAVVALLALLAILLLAF